MIELVIKRLPPENRVQQWAKKLNTIVKEKSDVYCHEKIEIFTQIHKNNDILCESIVKLCKGKLSDKQLYTERHSDESLDIRSFFSPFSQAFLTIAEDICLKPQHYSVGTARENVIKALDGFNNAITLY